MKLTARQKRTAAQSCVFSSPARAMLRITIEGSLMSLAGGGTDNVTHAVTFLGHSK